MRVTRRRLLRDGLGGAAALAGGDLVADAASAALARRESPYALGFRSLVDEVRLPDLPVDGRLPSWLSGVLVRNGPALFEIGEQQLNHWFDGLAMLHGFCVRATAASPTPTASCAPAPTRLGGATGRMKYSEFATDPCRTIFSGVSTLPVLGRVPNANVSIEQLAGRFVAHTELPVPVRFDPRSLRTLGVDVELPNARMGTAHPHHDPAYRRAVQLRARAAAAGRACGSSPSGPAAAASWPSCRRSGPGYLHSFALTDRYVAVFTQPWCFDLAHFLAPDRGPIVTNFGWDGSQASRVVLVDRARGGRGRDVRARPVLRLPPHQRVRRRRPRRPRRLRPSRQLDRRRDVPAASCAGRRPHPAGGAAAASSSSRGAGASTCATWPRATSSCRGPTTPPSTARPYRYAYGVGVHDPRTSGFVDGLAKLDIGARRAARGWRRARLLPRRAGLRPPSRDDRGEDDGVLLSVVLDASRRTSYLLVLDARDMSELARASVPHHIPFGFHGLHAAAGRR